ncbi:hypothetical protein [Clostridium sp.]|uniref:hypothetical protein n=1 Tax=Clostridium sp. TaxID=1506 RepID=UPI001A5BF0CF|nr:hypothetical protein [Clostridium sp.]MBK5235828.1 hypothetical protein [Clostridium sp.]
MQNFLDVLYPILLTVLTGFLAYIGKEVVKLAPKIIDFVVAKVGLTNYTKSKLLALDIFNLIEEHFRLSEIIGDTVQAKQIMFETLIKQKIPGITDANIELLRQSIAGEFNKNKPLIIKAIEDPVTIAEPIIKYFNSNGIELQPITTPEAEATIII